MTDAEALAVVKDAFRDAPRPEHFTDFSHCEECCEHDEVLRAHTRESITHNELGNPGWDPICFANTEGFHYYVPAMGRLALATEENSYLGQFLFHMSLADRLNSLSRAQKAAIASFLRHMRETRRTEIERNLEIDELDALLEALAATPNEL